jgi:hypothetical protein
MCDLPRLFAGESHAQLTLPAAGTKLRDRGRGRQRRRTVAAQIAGHVIQRGQYWLAAIVNTTSSSIPAALTVIMSAAAGVQKKQAPPPLAHYCVIHVETFARAQPGHFSAAAAATPRKAPQHLRQFLLWSGPS